MGGSFRTRRKDSTPGGRVVAADWYMLTAPERAERADRIRLCRRLVDTDLHNEPTADFDRWQLNEGIRLAVQTELTRAQDARLLDEIVGQIRRASEQRRLLVARNQSLDTQSSSGSLSREHLELLRKADSLHRERAVQPPTTD